MARLLQVNAESFHATAALITSFASVSGGRNAVASGYYSSVSGGSSRSVSGLDDWRAGTLFEDD